eukprot:TRINITY_DN933_c0_g1_i1.p1 TRINITY_DN933_c0_g1~~TRINITY_DN933_c0_g1_i1.p1  ORF type:complete len:381 (-),score=91.57 TRINITY_DN933_c0_g1_i1:479-1621(-)
MKIIKNCKNVKATASPGVPRTPSSPLAGKNPLVEDGGGGGGGRRGVNSISGMPHSAGSADNPSGITTDELQATLASLEHTIMTKDQWMIDTSELEYTLKLGAGSSGKVYKGLYRGKEVAVKVLKQITNQAQLDEFKKEFHIMAAIRSTHMVTFYGACIEPKLCMVMEFCSRDSLYHVMNSSKYEIKWDKFFKFSRQMTEGVACLHNWTPQIVHRDFKSLNLLVNENWDCKVADFGLSRFNTPDNLQTLSQLRGTFAYCAPEVATGSGVPYTTKSDVYSIGIVFWELITRVMTGEYHRPFSEFTHIKMDFQIMLNSKEGVRPTLPGNTPPALKALYQATVSQAPEDRPSCTEMSAKLKIIEEDYNRNSEAWDILCGAPSSS